MCSVESCKSILASNYKHNLNILTQNIRSITKNFDAFEVFLKRLDLPCEIYILTETWNSKAANFPPLLSYDLHYTREHRNQNDGIVMYTKQGLNCSVEEVALNDATCIALVIENHTVVIGIYRSPSQRSIDTFLLSLDKLLTQYKNYRNLIVAGDLNIDIKPNNEDKNSEGYLNLLASHGILPGHTYPTREHNCIDHLMIKATFDSSTIVIDAPITDHCAVLSSIATKAKTKQSKNFIINKINYDAIVNELLSKNFNDIINPQNPNYTAKAFVDIIHTSILNNSLKIITPRRTRCIKPWITPGLLRCMKNRDRMHIKSKKETNNIVLQITYTRYKNYCNDLLKRLKRNYEKSQLNKHIKNPKLKWKIIDSITNRNNKKERPIDLLKAETTPQNALNKANTYFTSIGKELAEKIIAQKLHINDDPERTHNPVNSMAMLETSEEEVEAILMNLNSNSATGWDDIPTKLLKMLKAIVVPVMTRITNSCIETGVFPEVFKTSLIHPIYKTGDRNCVGNYRPISVLPALSKIVEKILNKRLISYLEKENILSTNQFGFRAGRSTADAVLELTEYVATHIDKQNKCIGVFLDLAKAFDTVSVSILLNKMEQLGIRGTSLKIFKDYLKNRKQRVKLANYYSNDVVCCEYGVPQGSVLGPTLFLLYINNLCDLDINSGRLFTFADDTSIVFHGRTWDEAKSNTETGLNRIAKWLNRNLLTLNTTKTKFILFGNTIRSLPPENNFKIQLHTCQYNNQNKCNCTFLDRTKTIKYLGVLLDEKLTWVPHINLLAERTRRLIYIFKKLRHVADYTLLKNVYTALAESILTYCISSWGGARKTHLINLERAQRALLKVIKFKPFRYPTVDLYSECDVLTVRQLYIKNIIIYQHKKLIYDDAIANRRTHKVCPTIRIKTSYIQKFQCYTGPMLYNNLNKILNIYPLNIYECKIKLVEWLKTQEYNKIESLFVNII